MNRCCAALQSKTPLGRIVACENAVYCGQNVGVCGVREIKCVLFSEGCYGQPAGLHKLQLVGHVEPPPSKS